MQKHGKGLGIADQGSVRILVQKGLYAGGMIRFNMGNDQIIRRSACKSPLEILEERQSLSVIDGVHNGDLLIRDQIGIVGNSVWNGVLPFKQIDVMVIGANIKNILCDFQSKHSFRKT